ncbi:MAG: hypothetical protein MH219_04305 [Marinobacter sp.]|nr:hypothetical protein [Marinobacter sp.]
MTRNLRHAGFDVPVNLDQIEQVADKLAYIAWKGKPVGEIREYDEFHFHHHVPGGMISNLQSQLAGMNMAHRMEELLEEAGRVRQDLGYPILVSPFAQYIVTQAFLNITGKGRYEAVADEIRRYVLGYFGEVPGKIDPTLYDKITRGQEPIIGRTGDYVAPQLEPARKRVGRAMSDDDLLLSIFYNDTEYNALKAAGPNSYGLRDRRVATGSLIKGVADRPWVRSFDVWPRLFTLPVRRKSGAPAAVATTGCVLMREAFDALARNQSVAVHAARGDKP